MTHNQLLKYRKKKEKSKSKALYMERAPQKKGICVRVG
jgi:ribosomal protein S12